MKRGAGKGHRSGSQLVIRNVVDREERILKFAPELERLAEGLKNLCLPTPAAGELFADRVTVIDLLAGAADGDTDDADELVSRAEYPLAAEEVTPGVGLQLWKPLLQQVAYFEHSSFRFVDGASSSESDDAFEGLVAFSGLARDTQQRWLQLSAELSVKWRQNADVWRIVEWRTHGMSAVIAEQRLFSEALAEALPRPEDYRKASWSRHQEESVKYYHSGKKRALSHDFAPIAMNQKPAVSVVDIDGDGHDDIYVMVRIGKNLLLHNRGDGTFIERADDYELAVKGNSTCSIFADFDNDGDQDLLLGRSVEKSLYFENHGSWYKAVTEPWAAVLPALAVSMSAADYNGDGLLDVYIATYRPELLGDGSGALANGAFGSGNTGKQWPERFLPPGDAAEYRRLHRETDHHFLEQIGPPNRLLVNKGGRFELAEESATVGVWENTLQATWADFDDDGDADLYMANDFAADCLFRNDGDNGFVNVANEVGANAFGFGMGASFGDYDGDGQQDLYVSNMFSKAGRRILREFAGVNPGYVKSVEGNVLYRRRADGGFEKVSGLKGDTLRVAKAGWSWGGQFADFDNDADLDLYALSGYFTAPKEIASDVDL